MKQCFIFLMILTFGTSVYAAYYPSRLDSNTDILVVPDAEDDLYIKHQVLNRAQHTIEMMSHVQTMGSVGGLVIDDLRKAMARGVKVKYLFEAVATMTGGGEFGLDSIPFLTEERLYKKSGSELVVNRISQRLMNSPFAINDLLHKKVLIVDRGTPNEIIIITGRNNHEVNFKWADLTFVIRRVNSNNAYLGDDIVKDFDKTWGLLRRYFQVEESVVLSDKDKERYGKIAFRPLNPTSAGREIDNLLKQEPKSGEMLASYQFRPESVRLITTDTFAQIIQLKLDKTLGLRSEIVDDVTNYLIGMLKNANKVEANIYALLLPANIRTALAGLVERNGEVTILTNSSKSLGSALPISTLTDAIESYSSEILVDLAARSNEPAADRVQMYAMVPNDSSDNSKGPTATHRKMWILKFPNGSKLSFFGSHNITTASSSKSDEMMIAAVDNRMADYFYSLNHRDIKAHYKKVILEEAKSKKILTTVTRQMGHQLFQSIY